MANKANLGKLRDATVHDALVVYSRYDYAREALRRENVDLLRWVASMTAVELHAVWERFVEARLVFALHHDPKSFSERNQLPPKTRVPLRLAEILVRGDKGYFDFRSTSDLFKTAKRWLGEDTCFEPIKGSVASHLDVLAAVRNFIVHRSAFSRKSYKAKLRATYGLTSSPDPGSFLNAPDDRDSAPPGDHPRLEGLFSAVVRAVERSCPALRKKETAGKLREPKKRPPKRDRQLRLID